MLLPRLTPTHLTLHYYFTLLGLCLLAFVVTSLLLPPPVLADIIEVECTDYKNPTDDCTFTPNPGSLSNILLTLDEINRCEVRPEQGEVICQTKRGANFSCTKNADNSAICTFAGQTVVECSEITDTAATCTIKGPTEAEIFEKLKTIAKTGPRLEIARVLSKICPKRNVIDTLQRECDAFIGAAFSDDVNIVAQAENVLIQITPDGANSSIDAAQISLRAQGLNITSRLSELRQHANKTNLLSFNVTSPWSQSFSSQNGLFKYAVDDAANPSDGLPIAENPINFGRLGLFVNGSFGQGDKDNSDNELAFDIKTIDITVGADYRLRRDLFFGLAFGYSANETTLNSGRGSFDLTAYHLILYGTYYPNDQVYVNASLNYGGNVYEQQRRIRYTQTDTVDPPKTITVNQTATADYFGLQTSFNITTGYQFVHQALTAEPFVQLQFSNTDVDDYRETMSAPDASGSGWAVIIDGQDVSNMLGVIGSQLTYTLNQSWGVLIPQARLEWLKQFADKVHFVEGKFAGDPNNVKFRLPTNPPDTSYFNVGLGVSAIFPNGRTAYLYYQTLFAFDDYNHQAINIGIRGEF